MRTEVFQTGGLHDINEAAGYILGELKEEAAGTATSRSRPYVIYFDGWDGLGASAVLRQVGRCLTTAAEEYPTNPVFSHVFHIDCSKWESRRAMQRTIVEKLGLPAPVMDMLDAQDEEDDYKGVAKSSRAEMPQVTEAIYQQIQKLVVNGRFLVIFHNGSSEEIDLDSFGFPMYGYSRNQVLWSFQGRFRLYPRTKVDRALKSTRTTTDVVLSARAADSFSLSIILSSEAEEVAHRRNITDSFCDRWTVDFHNRQAQYWFKYMMKLCRMGSHLVDYELTTHGCNYWKCDGIMQLQEEDVGTDDDDGADRLWLYGDALHREMQLDADYYQNPYVSSLDPVVRGLPGFAYWSSPTYGCILIPEDPDNSYLDDPDNSYLDPIVPKGMFQQFDKLRVLKLSACGFSFTSPPFLCCHSLRFLWLDHCHDTDERGTENGEAKDDEDIQRCFRRLWVLDMRYSSSEFLSAKIMDFMTQLRELYVMAQQFEMDTLQERLHNIRNLRVTKCDAHTSDRDGRVMFSGKDKMELLDFSEFRGNIERLSVESSCSSLETVIINRSNTLKEISLKGCAKLKSLLLSGLFPQLYSLDLSNTAVKTLDFSAVIAPKLDELFLVDCEKLCAILWPSEYGRKRYPSKLRINTTQKEATAAGDSGSRSPAEFGWHICVRDARLLGSLEPIKDYFGPNDAFVEISTTASMIHPHAYVDGSKGVGIKSSSGQQVQVNLLEIKDSAMYADVTATLKGTAMQHQADNGDSEDSVAVIVVCPPAPRVSSQGCYIHIDDKMNRTKLQTSSHDISVPRFIWDATKILHMHDSKFITSLSGNLFGTEAQVGEMSNQLEWCRVERCPKLEGVFGFSFGSTNDVFLMDALNKLKIMWASHLPKAYYIISAHWDPEGTSAFGDLTLLHIYCCPRLIITMQWPRSFINFKSLESLEIMWCGELPDIFHVPIHGNEDLGVWLFPKLKLIHLLELPKLFEICPSGRSMHAPMLETVKVRGCWRLRTLPIVSGKNRVVCNCEKEWWDKLQWDSDEQRSHYKPIHSRYYKKTMLRGSPLR